jgi:NAD(P)-dependent dehydrogenase (short-subunit alcohol dehydrogenase family)
MAASAWRLPGGLAKSGATVVVWGRNEQKNADALRQLRDLGGTVAAFICDVTDEQQVVKTFAETVAQVGKVDVCFANAGGSGKPGMLHKMDTADWNAVLNLNLNSVVNTYKPMIAHLLERKAPGKLIVTSSEAAVLGHGVCCRVWYH